MTISQKLLNDNADTATIAATAVKQRSGGYNVVIYVFADRSALLIDHNIANR